jgi:putative salt-induced outer membrane protein YdiY
MYLQRPLRLWITALWMICASTIGAQIVNIEKQRIPADSTGWFGSANLSFAGSKTTKSIVSLFAGGQVECKSKSNKDLWLFISEFSLISGDNEKFSNTGFGHIRYNRKLNDAIRWEFFTQIQYNGLTKIDTRALGGTGLRFKLTPYEQAKFYFGLAYMYEYEKLLDPVAYHRDHRISSYFTFTLLPEETVSFTSTTYVQPLITDFSDYRITNETNLSLGITKKLQLNVTFKYNYDVAPPEGVPTNTYYFINGLELSF